MLGVVFGAAVDDADLGFVLTADEVASHLKRSALPNRWPLGPASADLCGEALVPAGARPDWPNMRSLPPPMTRPQGQRARSRTAVRHTAHAGDVTSMSA